MLGSFITRGLVMVFGYAYPAYECYKTVEKNKPEIEQLRFWCQYWILVVCLTVFERVGDAFVSWVPMYSEAKLAFFIYLWYPKTKGTTYVYDSFFRPYVAKHEKDIDRSLLELRTRAGDMVVVYWQRAASYGQTRIFDVLQYIAAQSTPRPQPPQKRGPRATTSATPKPKQAPKTPQSAVSEEPLSPTSSSSSSEPEAAEVTTKATGPPKPETSTSETSSDSKKTRNTQTLQKSVSVPIAIPTQSTPPAEAEPMEIEEAEESPSEPDKENENENPSEPPTETVMEETLRVTRSRLRKTRSAETR